MHNFIRRLKITSTSTERQKRSQNLAPVLVILSVNSLVFSIQYWFLAVLRPRRVSTGSGKKSVSHSLQVLATHYAKIMLDVTTHFTEAYPGNSLSNPGSRHFLMRTKHASVQKTRQTEDGMTDHELTCYQQDVDRKHMCRFCEENVVHKYAFALFQDKKGCKS